MVNYSFGETKEDLWLSPVDEESPPESSGGSFDELVK